MLLTLILTFAVREVKSTFDQEIGKTVKSINMGLLPRDIAEQVSINCEGPELISLSHVNQNWKAVCKEEMSRRPGLVEEAQLINKLEGFRTKSASPFDRNFISQMNPSEEIEHYLNGFDLRMYDWLMAFHIKVNDAVQKEIEEFATKLAEHRATYPRPPPHRYGNQENMPLFDAFVRMRDNNMEILQERMRKDHIMFDYAHRHVERSAMIEMMMIMETIGLMIDYPGVQERMEKNGKCFGFGVRLHEQQVQKLLDGTVDIRQLKYGVKTLLKVLSLKWCIGQKAAGDIAGNVQAFVRDVAHIEVLRNAAADFSHRKLVNELESIRAKTVHRFDSELISQMNPSEEIEHYLNGFDLRMYEWMMAFYTKVDGAVKQQIEGLACKLAEHRAAYPRLPPHRRGQQEEMHLFDAFIKMRDNNMEILQNRMKIKDDNDHHIMFPWNLSRGYLSLERSAMIQMMLIMETIGIEIGYPGVQKMQKDLKSFGLSQDFEEQIQERLVVTVDITQWEYIFRDGTKKSLMDVLSLKSCIGRKAAGDVVHNVRAFIRFSSVSAAAGAAPTPDTVEGVLRYLGILDCIEKLNAEGYEFRDLPIAEPDDLEGEGGIGLTAEQTRRIVTYFRPIHPTYASGGVSTDDQRLAEETQLVNDHAEAVPLSFDQEIKNAVKSINIGLLPRDRNEDGDLKEDMEEKRVSEESERAQLVNELEGFRTNCAHRFDSDLISRMNASDEIEHYLNGFDLRMYERMMTLHTKANGAVKQQIEEFARKLAEHRATYPRPSPHRRGEEKDILRVDAFIKMRDDNTEILQKRMRKDNFMFDYLLRPDPLHVERSAMIEMMKIMETIGIVIGYPGLQERMQKDSTFYFFGFSRYCRQVQKLLDGTVDITQWEYGHNGKRSLVEVLSLESCIGREAADDVVRNVREFVRDLAHIEASKSVRDLSPDLLGHVCAFSSDRTQSSLSQVSRRLNEIVDKVPERKKRVSHRKLVNELQILCTIAQKTPGMSDDFMKSASEEIEHYLNGFESRMVNAMGFFHSKSDKEVQQQIEEFASKLAEHRATYPRPPPHRLGDQREMHLFDAFIKMRDDNMEILQNRMKKDHMMFAIHYGTPLCWERQAVMEVMWIMENIGIVIGYPGLQEMLQKLREKWKFSEQAQQKARDFLGGTDDFFEWECGIRTVRELLSRNSCIGVTATEVIVQNFKTFIEIWRGLQ